MAWPFFKKKSTEVAPEPAVPPAVVHPDVANASAIYEGFAAMSAIMGTANLNDVKNFDWAHYQALNQGAFGGMFQGEFGVIPTMRIMKGMLIQEPWINACTNAIARQFLNTRFLLKKKTSKDGNTQIISNHKILQYLNEAGKQVEDSSFFTSNRIADLVTTGNGYIWNSPDKKEKRGIPADRMEPVVRDNRIVEYRLIDRTDLSGVKGNQTTFPPEEITHIKMPNPFTPHIGMSMIVATVLPVLIDKYGREYVVGFFLRGGTTAGIIETDSNNAEQLMRLAKTLMQAFGGRKNMHADKILPKGAKWSGQGNTFGEIRLIEMLKENISHFRAATGCTNTVLGLVDNVNRATAQAEMELFWKATILPMQKLYCSAIKGSALWEQFGLDDSYDLIFDNSEVEYIDDFGFKLDQDSKLVTWTVNERRERLGKDKLGPEYDKLYEEIKPAATAPTNLSFAFPQQGEQKSAPQLSYKEVWKAVENDLQDPTKAVLALFSKEFGAWEAIVLDSLHNRRSAEQKVHDRRDQFAKHLSEKTIKTAMAAYSNQLQAVVVGAKAAGVPRKKESDQDRAAKLRALEERAKQVIQDGIFENGKKTFLGYSKTAMDSIYDFIEAEFQSGKSEADVASAVRSKFNESYSLDEAYKGQAQTIVQTEFGSALSIATQKFGQDLTTVTDEMEKEWVTLGDKYVRDSHAACEDQGPIRGKSAEVIDAVFANGLRYPRESGAPAEEVVNCRCTQRFAVISWKD